MGKTKRYDPKSDKFKKQDRKQEAVEIEPLAKDFEIVDSSGVKVPSKIRNNYPSRF